MSSENDLFEVFNRLRVLVIGDVMIDQYLSGSVSRISPEAPVPVVSLQQRDSRLGGAANVALNIKAMGAYPILCSVVGTDQRGTELLELMPSQGLSTIGILQSKSRPTTVKTRIIAGNQHLLRVDQEITDDLSEEDLAAFVDLLDNLIKREQIDLVIFQDYNKGVLSKPLIELLIGRIRDKKIPMAADPKEKNFWSYRQVDLFKPNLREIKQQIPETHADLESLTSTSRIIKSRLQNQYTLITLSEKGMFLEDNGRGVIIPAQVRAVADVCGAGDTVISVAALGLALPEHMEQIAFLANLAGGQVCEKVGVVPVDKELLRKEYEEYLREGETG